MTARPPSRFVRGRARGGGGYRPYFYFRRGGRTIPAGNRQPQQNPVGEQQPPVAGLSTAGRILRGRGGVKRGSRAKTIQLDSSYIRPKHYVAPEDALIVNSFAVDNPAQCPGWRLYFYREDFVETSDIAKRITVLEAHYKNNLLVYDLMKIQNECIFTLDAGIIKNDKSVMENWPTLIEDLRARPLSTLSILAVAMHSAVTIAVIDASLSQPQSTRDRYVPNITRQSKIYARPIGFQSIELIDSIAAAHIDQMFCLRGCVTSIEEPEVSVGWIAYSCTRCKMEQSIRQTGANITQPTACKRENCLAKNGFIELRSSPCTRLVYKQMIRLTEFKFDALLGTEMDVSDYMDIELRHDLVDSIHVGQDIVVTGVLKLHELNENNVQVGQLATNMQVYMKAVAIRQATQVDLNLSEIDMSAISMINSEPDSFKLLVQSLAPEVHGHELAKAGVLLSLFGGGGSQVDPNGPINVLLVGDPGIGKSKLLEIVAKISDHGSHISGKRSLAAGQKVGVSVQGSAGYTMNAGALMTALNGHCIIDDIDRLATEHSLILQTMQTQTINLPFPSLFTSLDAPVSIIASANPQRGHYDCSKLLEQNVRILPKLLKEFHLVFVLLDKPDKESDISLVEHVRALHDGTKKSKAIAAKFEVKPKSNSMTMMFNETTAGCENGYDLAKRLSVDSFAEEPLDLLPPLLMKKFIAYARQHVHPLLTDEAAEEIKKYFMELKENKQSHNQTTNQLLGLIRLTQARARIDFVEEATEAHVRDVIAIVDQSMADTALGDYYDTKSKTIKSKGGNAKRFLQMLQLRANSLGRRVFDFDELKDMATHAGITCGVTNLIDILNEQGFLLKKGPNVYEVLRD